MINTQRQVLSAVLALSALACASGSGGKGKGVATEPIDSSDASVGVDAGAPEEPELPDDSDSGEEDWTPTDPRKEEGVCGDLVCNINETCASCEPDCGRCPECTHAPTCTGAVAVPSFSVHLEEFDNGDRVLYSSGVDETTGEPLGTDFTQTDCIAPQLRMRVRQIKVVRDGVSGGTADLYCIINASDGAHEEVMITPLQKDIGDDAPPILFPDTAAMFWGQGMPWQTLNNLTITYQCFRAVSNESYKKVFDAIQNGSQAAGGIAGANGWAFGAVGVVAGLISAAIPEGNDQTRIMVQQTIDRSMLLELTNGRRWTIRGTGGPTDIFGGGVWDWSLEVESWGCSDARIPPPQ